MGTLEHLAPLLADAAAGVLAVWGALTFEAAYTAPRAAARLPEGYYHPVTSFSRAIMGAHATTVAVELHTGRESVRQAGRADAAAIPSRPRAARHRIEQARAYHLDGQADAAVTTLEQA